MNATDFKENFVVFLNIWGSSAPSGLSGYVPDLTIVLLLSSTLVIGTPLSYCSPFIITRTRPFSFYYFLRSTHCFYVVFLVVDSLIEYHSCVVYFFHHRSLLQYQDDKRINSQQFIFILLTVINSNRVLWRVHCGGKSSASRSTEFGISARPYRMFASNHKYLMCRQGRPVLMDWIQLPATTLLT